jgi:hypothetical protein
VLTTLLWITLIALIILLIAVASPIKVSCKAVYKESEHNTEFRAAAHYLHPLILKTEYSTETEEFYLFILGFKKRFGDDKDNQGIDTEDINIGDVDVNNIDTDDINTNSIDTNSIDTNDVNTEDVYTNSIDTNNIDTDGVNTNDINTNEINTDSINTEDTDKSDAKEKKISLMSKIKSKINDIKRHRAYKIISNKPLLKKLLRWLKRSSVRAIRTVSLKKLKLHIRIGLQDPAKLGKIYGYFSATQSALTPQHYRVDLNMTPVFTEKCLSIDSELEIKTTLSTILWQLTMIAVTFPYWRVWRIIRIKS